MSERDSLDMAKGVIEAIGLVELVEAAWECAKTINYPAETDRLAALLEKYDG